MTQRYSILIQWSDEEQVYIAALPEFGPYVRTHGNTYVEALYSAEELLAIMLEHYQAKGKELTTRDRVLTTNLSNGRLLPALGEIFDRSRGLFNARK